MGIRVFDDIHESSANMTLGCSRACGQKLEPSSDCAPAPAEPFENIMYISSKLFCCAFKSSSSRTEPSFPLSRDISDIDKAMPDCRSSTTFTKYETVSFKAICSAIRTGKSSS
jgi:hypothetical protein